MNNYYVAIVSARLGSSRFPEKVISELWNNKTVIEILIERLKLSKRLNKIAVACPKDDIKLLNFCNEKNIKCYNLGDNELALYSVINVAQQIESEYNRNITIIDITADCPFIDPFLLDEMIDFFEETNYNYISNVITRSFPIGFDLQIYNSWLLYEIENLIINNKHKIHSGWNIPTYSLKLKLLTGYDIAIGNICAIEKYFLPTMRIVLDYKEDLIFLKNIINYFNRIDFTYQEIINYVLENKELLKINKNCNQKIAGV